MSQPVSRKINELLVMSHENGGICWRCLDFTCSCTRERIWSDWCGSYQPRDHTDAELQRSYEACEVAMLAWARDGNLVTAYHWNVRAEMCREEIERRMR